eukprot:m.353208 g.353208  ORF g.353208 m.353208 type:complete len:60 (-) comp16590_c0_seq2:278-457(-)
MSKVTAKSGLPPRYWGQHSSSPNDVSSEQALSTILNFDSSARRTPVQVMNQQSSTIIVL